MAKVSPKEGRAAEGVLSKPQTPAESSKGKGKGSGKSSKSDSVVAPLQGII